MKNCLESNDLGLESILLLPDSTHKICLDRLGAMKTDTPEANLKSKRDINLLSKLFGDGDEILSIEHTLSSAIETFNHNFLIVDKFDKQVKASLNDIDQEIFVIEENEKHLRRLISELKIDMIQVPRKLSYYIVKMQHLMAISDVLKQSRLSKTWRLNIRTISKDCREC